MSKLTWRTSTLAALITSFSFSTTVAAEGVSISDEVRNYVKDSYIFVFKDTVNRRDVASRAKGLVRSQGGKLGHTYSHTIRGFSAKMPAAAAARLAANNPSIAYFEQDGIMLAVAPKEGRGKPPKDDGGDPPATTCEQQPSTPWGITRVGGAADGAGKTAWVIDSGIDLDHPDLNVDVDRSRSFLSGRQADNPDDQNGHGTHVAGTIAAKNDDCGVIGVAADATVVAVRVLDRRGSGYTSGVIAGVDYVGANASAGDVANMSLGGGISSALDQAVYNATVTRDSAGDVTGVTGIIFALAAGNESDNADNHSPARVNGQNIYTVSAINSGDNFASFSNYGSPPVDCAAPGVGVFSTYKNGGYTTASGTSMAAPHVAGLLLLGAMAYDGTASGDPDGNPDPICHR